MGWENKKIKTFEQLITFINNSFSIIKGDFMGFEYTFPENNRIHWEMKGCFAYRGMEMFGFTKEYEC